jgi:hypothetical protein
MEPVKYMLAKFPTDDVQEDGAKRAQLGEFAASMYVFGVSSL